MPPHSPEGATVPSRAARLGALHGLCWPAPRHRGRSVCFAPPPLPPIPFGAVLCWRPVYPLLPACAVPRLADVSPPPPRLHGACFQLLVGDAHLRRADVLSRRPPPIAPLGRGSACRRRCGTRRDEYRARCGRKALPVPSEADSPSAPWCHPARSG